MDSHQFIAILKKEILRKATPAEQLHLEELLEKNEDYKMIYRSVFSDMMEENDEVHKAYERQLNRMKKLKLL